MTYDHEGGSYVPPCKKISFIVSVYDRMDVLNACLASLKVQSVPGEIFVCHNGNGYGETAFDSGMWNHWWSTGSMGAKSCYESANMIAPKASGEWLCFPSDDSLYVQGFSRIMLETAEREKADLVYCDCVYAVGSEKNHRWAPYSVLTTQPRIGKIDKTCFIVRRNLFKGFPVHFRNWSDGAFIQDLIKQGVRHAKAPGVLVVHQ